MTEKRRERVRYWRDRLVTLLANRAEGYVQNGDLCIGREALTAQSWAGIGQI